MLSFCLPIASRFCKLFLDLQCSEKADICFVLDSSGSICGNRDANQFCEAWFLLLSFVTSVVDAFDIGTQQTRIGIVTFSSDATLVFPMDRYSDKNLLKKNILSISHTGGPTNTGKALHITRTACFNKNNGDRVDVPNIAVVITDGFPTVVEFDINKEAVALHQVGTVLAVGITDSVESRFLKVISSPSQLEHENYFTAADFSVLRNILDSIISKTCGVSSLKPSVLTRSNTKEPFLSMSPTSGPQTTRITPMGKGSLQ